MTRNVTLLDLVNAVAEHARSEAEMIATIVYMVNQGHVRLRGTFKGARFDVTSFAQPERGRGTAMSLIPGTRCRSARNIVFPGGIVRRATLGTLVSQRENLGRELFTVNFDSGQRLILFAHEIEPVSDDLAA